jgi:hypothetical protein
MVCDMKLTMAHLRKLNLALLPETGGWVALTGNPYAARGHRLVPDLIENGLGHMDIVWAVNERIRFNLHVQSDFNDLDHSQMVGAINSEMEAAGIDINQLTCFDIVSPNIKTYLWRGEVRLIGDDTIKALLAENMLELRPFDLDNPVLKESIRDIVDALQVDGLSLAQAQAEALRWGVIKQKDLRLPAHFYRLAGIFRDTFVEEQCT